MKKVTETENRKADHIRVNLEEDVASSLTTGLECYRFIHEALPEVNLSEIDLSLPLFGKQLQAPLLISSMTGGTDEAIKVNRNLALAAQQTGIAMGVGSQRAAIENPALAASFQVRQFSPDILLFANLGAVQLNYGYGLDECRRAVEMIEADALILHFNALQEALQPEGQTNFKGILKKIQQLASLLRVPIIAKEVGWGFSAATVRRLANAGVSAIDIAGAGGTSWSQVEMHRSKTAAQVKLAARFIDWGIPTAESILEARQAAPKLPIIASGGLRSGLDIAKTIALGASLGGMAGPFLKSAAISAEAVVSAIDEITHLLRVVMFSVGVNNLTALTDPKLLQKISK